MKNILKLTTVLLIMLSANISAEMYYLHDLINQGLESSINIIRSETTRKNVQDSHTNSYLDLFLPSASYSASYIDPSRMDDYYSSSLSIGKSLYLNEPTYFNLRRSSLEKQIAALNHENLRKKIVLDITSAYIDIILQQKRIKIAQDNLVLQRRLHEQMQIQYENRTKTIYDLQQSQIDTLNIHIQVLEMQDSLSNQRENLFFMIKLEDKGYPLEDYDFKIIPEENINYWNFTNLNLESSALSLQKSKFSLTQQYLSLFPSLSIGYNWSTGSTNDNPNDTFFVKDNYHDSSTFSISLSYPLFSFFQQGLNYRIAKRNHQIEKIELDNLNEDITQQINIIEADLGRLKQTYDLYVQRRDLARVSLQIAEERFVLGIISYLDLDNARIQYLDSEDAVLNRFYAVVKKQEELNYIKSNNILGIW